MGYEIDLAGLLTGAMNIIPKFVEIPFSDLLPADAFQLHNLIENYVTALQIQGILGDLEAKWFNDGSWLIRLP